MMRNRGLIIFLIVILAIMAISITSGMIFLLKGGNMGFLNFRTSTVSNEKIHDQIYDTLFKEIKIDSDAGDIYIKTGNDKETKVVIYGDVKQLEVNDTDNLYIKYVAKKCIGLCFNVKKSKIEIYLPKDYEGNLDIENKYGDTTIAEFLNANANVSAYYGDIDIDGINDAKVHNKCGDITIDTINNADVENNYGDIEIKNVLSSVNVDDDCGDIEINNLTIEKNSTIKNSLGDIDIGMTNDIRIDAHTSLGDIDVRNNNTKSDIVLTIDNSCGDITVKN